MTTVGGLDRHPPDQAGVLGGDGKSRRQALDRTPPGRRGTLTHDSQRQGPTMLCTAWHVLPGPDLDPCPGRLRQQAFLQCLRRLDRAFPPDLTLPDILDHSTTHQPQTVRSELAARAASCTARPPEPRGSISSRTGAAS